MAKVAEKIVLEDKCRLDYNQVLELAIILRALGPKSVYLYPVFERKTGCRQHVLVGIFDRDECEEFAKKASYDSCKHGPHVPSSDNESLRLFTACSLSESLAHWCKSQACFGDKIPPLLDVLFLPDDWKDESVIESLYKVYTSNYSQNFLDILADRVPVASVVY
jgi:hypothetical protein